MRLTVRLTIYRRQDNIRTRESLGHKHWLATCHQDRIDHALWTKMINKF